MLRRDPAFALPLSALNLNVQLAQPPQTPLLRNRLTQLLLLAVTVLSYSVLSIAIGNSLFVSYVGASHLPLAFMLIGLCSIPAYILFSQLIDRYSRPQLFRYILLASIGAIVGLRLLLLTESTYAYYILLIALFFQWDFHNNVLYPTLLTDYFTTLEYKRYAPYISVAQAVGTLLGGGLTALLSQYLRTRELLWCLPILFAVGVVQLVYLENSQRQVNRGVVEPEVSLWESLQTFPELIRRYPLALFLAASSFLLVIIYIGSEFLWFNIYGSHFSDQALTGFLGLMRVLISLVQIAVIYGLTQPLLRWLGVAQMNPVYPLTTLASFVSLITHFGLPAAIALHINGDAIYKAINVPVHQLNYNAIPQEFIGRIRTLSDGFIYAIGLTLAGALLWLGETRLSLVQIAGLIAVLTVVLLLVRLPMGRFYAKGLDEMIRSNSINLDDLDIYAAPLPPQSNEAVRELLLDPHPYTQAKGLELAVRMNDPSQFLDDVEALIPTADLWVYGGAIALFQNSTDAVLTHWQQRLESPTLQAFALEVLLINGYSPETEQVQIWQAQGQIEMQILGAIAQRIVDPAAAPDWSIPLNGKTARILTRVITYSRYSQLMPLISTVILAQTQVEVIRAGLEALLPLTQPGDPAIAAIAEQKVTHPDALVRLAAFDLLGITRCPEQLPTLSQGLGDADPRVRQRAAQALASYGRSGLDIAKAQLGATQPEVVDMAITAIGLVRTKAASNLLFDYLTPSYKQLAQTRRWQQQIPRQDPNWYPLQAAIQDSQERLIQRVLYVLSALGYGRTVNVVRRLLATRNQAELEKAIEVLASLSHRRFVLPLIPLFEQDETSQTSGRSQVMPQWFRTRGYRLLLEALEAKDRWIRSGALLALAVVPSMHIHDPDPVVRQITGQIFGERDRTSSPLKTVMNQLLFLKTVALFKNLSLDELLLIEKSAEISHALAGETIFNEGEWGAHLYIVVEGTVQLVKEIDQIPQELKQLQKSQHFGEIALFDDAPRWDSAIALADCTLLKIEKNRFLSLITQRPHIILEMCRFLSQRLRETAQQCSPKLLATALEHADTVDSETLKR
ncbi:MAG: cyclic nucleotide-binding domain-containing protein [Cyanobacteria bacterium P01_G01_bin.54]